MKNRDLFGFRHVCCERESENFTEYIKPGGFSSLPLSFSAHGLSTVRKVIDVARAFIPTFFFLPRDEDDTFGPISFIDLLTAGVVKFCVYLFKAWVN